MTEPQSPYVTPNHAGNMRILAVRKAQGQIQLIRDLVASWKGKIRPNILVELSHNLESAYDLLVVIEDEYRL